jgi:hypothetical protein
MKSHVRAICCVAFLFDLELATADTGRPPISAPPTKNTASWTDFGPMRAYVDGTGWFSMSVPAGWAIQDESNDFARMLRIIDPFRGATLFVRTQLQDAGVDYRQSEALLRAVIGMRFSGGHTLVREAIHSASDGGRTMRFSYAAVTGNKTQPIRGESVLRLHDKAYLSILAFTAPADMFEDLRAPVLAMFDTYMPHPQALEPDKLEIDTLRRYRHPGGLFEVSVPANWLVSDESTLGQVQVKFYDPAKRAGMAVKITRTALSSSFEPARLTLLGNVRQDYGEMEQFRVLSSRGFSNSIADAAFSYQAELRGELVPMLGRYLLRRDRGVVGTLRVLIPGATASKLWTHVIDIGASFKVNVTAPIP